MASGNRLETRKKIEARGLPGNSWMMNHEWPAAGDHVIYHDEKGTPYNALVTACWGNPETSDPSWGPCINLLHVTGDEARTDQYGFQIERPSSVSHATTNRVHGRYWRWPDEEPNPYVPPSGI